VQYVLLSFSLSLHTHTHNPYNQLTTTAPTKHQMLNIVKVMSMSVQSDEKVAVHCHAGFGRTGMVIACFLIYFRKFAPSEAIRAVRIQRGKCIEKKAQLEYVYEFERFIKESQIVFAIHTDLSPFSIGTYLEKFQYQYLHGEESRTLRYLPKIVLVLCSLLNEMAVHNPELLAYAFSYVLHREKWEQSEVARVMKAKEEINKMRDWEKLKQENPRVLVHLLIDWLRHLKRPIFSDDLAKKCISIAEGSRHGRLGSRGGGGGGGSLRVGHSPLVRRIKTLPPLTTTTTTTPEKSKRPVTPSSIECGNKIISLLQDTEERNTILCILKVAKKLSKSLMYKEVLDIVASACTHRYFDSSSSSSFSSTTKNNHSSSSSSSSSHGIRKSTVELRRKLRLTFHCMVLASKHFSVPQIRAFPIEDAPSHSEDDISEAAQERMMKDMCAIYRKLPMRSKNKVLSVLADIYTKALEDKQEAFKSPMRRGGR